MLPDDRTVPGRPLQDINPTFSPAAAAALVEAAEAGMGQLKPEDRSACEEALQELKAAIRGGI